MNTKCKCDCINDCGDDPDVRRNAIEGCDSWKKGLERQRKIAEIREKTKAYKVIADEHGSVVIPKEDLGEMMSLMTINY